MDNEINLGTLTSEVCEPYVKQKNGNVGLIYEIVALFITLRKMGLTNDNLDTLSPTINSLYTKMNNTNKEKLRQFFASLRNTPVGCGYYIEGKKVVNIRNTTQTGDSSGIDDLTYILEDGSEKRVSVHCGSVKKDGTIEKCISNPTSRRFGIRDDLYQEFRQMGKDTKPRYIAEMTAKYPDSSTWKNLTGDHAKTAAADNTCSNIARLTVDNFHTLPRAKQEDIIQDVMRIKSGPPADYSVVVSKDLKNIRLFKLCSIKIDTSHIILRASGIYIEFVGSDNKVFGKTQVKFNDGVWREHKDGKWKSSPVHTSWDSVCKLTDIFDMKEVK